MFPSLAPPSDPFSISVSIFKPTLLPMLLLPPMSENGKIWTEKSKLLTLLLISAVTLFRLTLWEPTFIAHYKTISPNGGVQCSVLPIRGHLAWKLVSVIYCQACPVHTHTQVMMVLAVWQITGPCTFDLLPCPVSGIASPRGFILTSHLGAASSCCHFGYPAYLFLSKDPLWFYPWSYSVFTAAACRAQFCAKPCLRIKYLIILLIRTVNFTTSKTSAKIFSFCL